MRLRGNNWIYVLLLSCMSCTMEESDSSADFQDTSERSQIPEPDFFLTKDQTHNKFSSSIPQVITVPSGAIIQAETKEATDGQLKLGSGLEDLEKLSFEPIHPLTGPVYVENAEPGDILAVTIHDIKIGSWGWTAIVPGFGFLAEEFTEPYLKTFEIQEGASEIAFNEKIKIPLKPFPGVVGVAPATDSLLSTIPPRANGGNMDDPNITVGTTIYFPVFVEGALFSIGDTHAAQGMGEVCGTAVEAPMTIIYEVNVIKNGRTIQEPQYESDEYYAVTGFAPTIDEAAKKATRYMIDYLVSEHKLKPDEAYALCSLAGELKIAEVVDVPNMLVSMHMSKNVLGL